MLSLYIKLLFAHFVADFGLQTSWMAEEKKKDVLFLIAHGFINGAMVYLFTWSMVLGVVEIFFHIGIDNMKNDGGIGVYEDQLLHLLTKVIYLWL